MNEMNKNSNSPCTPHGVYNLLGGDKQVKNTLFQVMTSAMKKNVARRIESDKRGGCCFTVHKVEQELDSWG